MEGTPEPLKHSHLQHEPEINCDKSITPITNEIATTNLSVDDHLLRPYYYVKDGEPYLLKFLFHNICKIFLAPNHSLFWVGFKHMNFKDYNKRYGTILSPESILAVLTDNNGKAYKIPACVHGKLVDVNTSWIKNAKRLRNPAVFFEYIVMIQSSLELCDLVKAGLMTQEDYTKMKRNKSTSENQQ